MKEKSNEEKAREIAEKYQTPCHGMGDCEFEAYQSALEAMQWKDEQFSLERKELIEKANQAVTQSFENGAKFKKQEIIERALNWINSNLCYYDESGFDADGNGILKDFKKAMEE
jgi:hypothetical protein